MTLPLAPSSRGRRSDCEAFRDIVAAKLGQTLSAQRIYQDLVADHGFAGSYYCVRRFVRRLDADTGLAASAASSATPGDEAQVDFGSGRRLVGPDGKRRRTHVFRIVLSHSRKGYSEAVPRQTTDDFLRCLENAFRHFGGVPPGGLVLDNLKAAVKQADWFDPELNPKVRSFGRALRHRVPADPALHAPAQGQGRAGRRLRPGQRPEGPDLRQPGRAEPASCSTGS